jgi:hypothetical protein
VRIYDAVSETPTQATIPLHDPLLNASVTYDEKNLQSKNKTGETQGGKGKEAISPSTSGTPVSFNPIVHLDWPEDQSLFIQTAYVRIYASEPVNTFQRWHKVNLSIQAKALSRAKQRTTASALAIVCYSAPL